MKVKFSKEFLKQYKKADVRIKNRVDNQIQIFEKNPTDSALRNHPLQGKFAGKRSIDITGDYRAIYKEITEIENEESTAYFIALGTHNQLYGR